MAAAAWALTGMRIEFQSGAPREPSMYYLKGRISRATYSVFLLAYAVVFAVAIAFQTRIPGEVLLAIICIPRLHDMGRSGWWVALSIAGEGVAVIVSLVLHVSLGLAAFASLIVLLGPALALLFFPGQKGTNRFGDEPDGFWERRLRPMAPWAVLGLVLMIGGGIWRAERFVHDSVKHDQSVVASFAPTPNNHTTILVRGWDRPDLNKILSDFEATYKIPKENIEIARRADGAQIIHFPNDIHPRLLLYLVNYLQYPKGFDLSHRTIGVLAHAQLSQAFGMPDPSLDGKPATIYVPEADAAHDVVYADVQARGAFVVTLADFEWKAAPSPRLPRAVAGL
jgi:uncharacterized membrane protein YhaH (DUF805 family)